MPIDQNRYTFAKIVSAIIALTSAGCMVGLDYKQPQTSAPARFGEASATQPSGQIDVRRWWRTFNDPELDRLIDRAVVNNNTLLQAQARVRQARAQLGVEWGNEFPTLSVNASAKNIQSSRNLRSSNAISGASNSTGGGNAGGGGTTAGGTGTGNSGSTSAVAAISGPRRSELYQGSFDAGWEIDVFGGNRRAIESAEYDLEAQINARRNTLVTLTAEVARDYVLLRGYQAQLKLTESNAKSESDTLGLTRSRFNAGLVSDLDVAQAQASVATTLAQVPALQINIKQEIHAISILLG